MNVVPGEICTLSHKQVLFNTDEIISEDRRRSRCLIILANGGTPSKAIPFDSLIPFDDLKKQVVLEIGVGSGSHAGLIAPRALSYTGIDLTDYAVKMTTSRMKLLGLTSVIKRMDAEKMEFPDNSPCTQAWRESCNYGLL